MTLFPNLRDLSTLQLALGVSFSLHAVLLTVRLVDPEGFDRVFQDTPLEVILVNAKSNERPDKARAIAQFSLAGGGETEKGRATTPLPPSALMELGDASEDAQKKIENLEQQQMKLLNQVKQQLAALPPQDPRQISSNPQAAEQEDKRRQLMRILAEIERRINEENARPRKRYVSPATREAVYALYYDKLRHRIEDKGTENFPELAGRKLYGELTMLVTVDADGRMVNAAVMESSGTPALDRRALAIARAASPFGRFNEAMLRQADQIVVVSRFKFTRDETLEAKLSSR